MYRGKRAPIQTQSHHVRRPGYFVEKTLLGQKYRFPLRIAFPTLMILSSIKIIFNCKNHHFSSPFFVHLSKSIWLLPRFSGEIEHSPWNFSLSPPPAFPVRTEIRFGAEPAFRNNFGFNHHNHRPCAGGEAVEKTFSTASPNLKPFKNVFKFIRIETKGNPDGSLSNDPSLRILWSGEFFDSLKRGMVSHSTFLLYSLGSSGACF